MTGIVARVTSVLAHGGAAGTVLELGLVVLLTAVIAAVVVKERRRTRGEADVAGEE